MGLAKTVGLIAVVPGAAAILLRGVVPLPVTLVLTHVACVGGLVALSATSSLSRATTPLLGKSRRSGRIAPWSWALLWPYHVGIRTKLAIQRRVSKEPVYNNVAAGWFIGGWPSRPQYLPPGNTAILDCTCELPLVMEDHPYKCLPTWDTHAPSVRAISEGVAWAREQRSAGRNVLVHCAHGHGRSATVLCAALIDAGMAGNAAEALSLSQEHRPLVRLNARQAEALDAWISTKKTQ